MTKEEETFLSAFQKLGLANGHFLFAFSGGPDSVFLLLMLYSVYQEKLSDHITLAYVNYHDSPFVDKEEEIVNHYASCFQLKIERRDTQFKKEQDHNFEEWARDYRYEFFRKTVLEKQLDGLLTAHHLSDSIETYQIQLLRKNIPLHYGLNDISYLGSLKVIRPLLDFTKEEIYDYLKKNNYPYYEDVTNADEKKIRNRLRKNKENITDQELILEMKKRNRKNEQLYASFKNEKSPYSFEYYLKLTTEEKQRFIFWLLTNQNLQVSNERITGLGKEVFEFLKRRADGSLPLDFQKTLYRLKDSFYLDSCHQNLNYEILVTEKRIYKNNYLTIDFSDPKLFNVSSLPVIVRNYHSGDKLSTNLPCKDVRLFLKKQQVGDDLLFLYPVIIRNGRIICVPFYKDIKEQKIPLKLTIRK